MINLSSRKYRIWVKIPNETVGFEVSEACSGDSGGFFVVTDDPIDEDGIFRTKGTLELVAPPGQEHSYNTWENGARWEIGNIVVVQIGDTSGVLRSHPRSHLRILSRPAPPYPGNPRITLELADANTWKENVPKDFQARLSIAQGLSRVGLAFSGSIPSITKPGTKSSSNKGFVASAGEEAIAGFSALWQNRSGAIVSKRLNLRPEQRLFKHIVGVDDAGLFEPIQNAIRAYSEVRVVNPNLESEDDATDRGGGGGEDDSPENSTGNEGGSITTKEYVPAEQIREGGGAGEVLAAVRKESWSWAGSTFTRTIEEKRLLGLCIPGELYTQYAQIQGITLFAPSPFTMIPSLVRTENHIYESGKEGRLTRIESSALQPRGQVLADFHKRNPPKRGASIPDYIGLVAAETSETEYTYQTGGGKDTGGQVRKILAKTFRLKGNVAGSATDWGTDDPNVVSGPDPNVLILAEKNVDTWIKRGQDNWEHRSTQGQAGQVRSGTIATYSALSSTTTVEVSRTGNAQPPAADRRPPKIEKQPKLKTLRFQTQSTETRIKVIENEFVDSEEQGEKLAEIFALISKAREQGFRIYSAWRDELFSYSPFSRIDIDYNGYTYLGITDVVTWTLGANQALVAIDCMRLGRVAVARYAADTYPFPSFAPPLPNDPDPVPLPEPDAQNLHPESFVQNIIPTAIPVRRLVSDRAMQITSKHYPIALGRVLPTQMAVSERSFDVVFSVRLVSDRQSQVVFRKTYVAVSRRSFDVVFAFPVVGLVSFWKLDSLAWADEQGLNPLTNQGRSYYDSSGDPQTGAVTVGTGDEGGAALFDGYSWLSSTSSSLDHGLSSFKISLKLWLPAILGEEFISIYDPNSGEYYDDPNPLYSVNTLAIASTPSQWEMLAVRDYSNHALHIEFTMPADEGSQYLISTLDLTLDSWHSIEASLDAATQIISIAVDGVVNSIAYNYSGSGSPFVEFRLGRREGSDSTSNLSPAGTRIDDAKFYIY